VGAIEEAVVPAALLVELPQHHQQFVGRGVQARGQCGDGFAEVFDRSFRFHVGW